MKKIITFVLLASMLISAMSCGSEGNVTPSVTTDPSTGGEESTADILPVEDFGGKSYRLVCYERVASDFISDEVNGDIVNDAVFERNAKIEETYKVKLEFTNGGPDGDMKNYVNNSILAGDNEFDVVSQHIIHMGKMATNKLLRNWYDVPNIDFDHEWWSHCVKDNLTYNGVAYIALGDVLLNGLGYAMCVFYDTEKAESYNAGDIYGMVREGKWTFDKLKSIVKDVYTDLNGNGLPDNEDFFGFCTGSGTAVNAYCWSFDNPIMRTSNGKPEYVFMNDRTHEKLASLIEFLNNSEGVYYQSRESQTQSYDFFANGHAMFIDGYVQASFTKSRDLKADFGMVPYPKFDENQENYYTLVDGAHSGLAVPVTVPDEDLGFVGLITEALCKETKESVVPKYYEIALKEKYTRDDGSIEMLDLIMDSRTYDFGYIYDSWSGVLLKIENLTFADSTDVASWYAGIQSSVEAYYDTLFGLFEEK